VTSEKGKGSTFTLSIAVGPPHAKNLEDSERTDDAFPTHQKVSQPVVPETPRLPTIVPLNQATRFHERQTEVGMQTTLLQIEGGGHSIGGPDVLEEVKAFFAKHLRPN